MSVIAEISKEFRFEAAHFLPNVPKDHPCHRLHGHSYKLTIRAKGPIDEKMGWVMDLKELSVAFASLARILDHTLLNEIEGLENPTGENVALWILRRLRDSVPGLSSVSLEATDRIAITVYNNT